MYNQEQYNKSKGRNLIDCQCDFCGADFKRAKSGIKKFLKRGRTILYCTKECVVKARTTMKVCPICSKEYHGAGKYCSRKCYNHKQSNSCEVLGEIFCKTCKNSMGVIKNDFYYKTRKNKECCSLKCAGLYRQSLIPKTIVQCGSCEKPLQKTEKQIKKALASKTGKMFCNGTCRTLYLIQVIGITRCSSRSVPEKLMYDKIKEIYPSLIITHNDRSILASKRELDIYLPTIKLAIEINGPVHYFPIYGEEHFEEVKLRDGAKTLEAHNMGISVLIVDVSRLESRNREKFISQYFEDYIKPVIDQKLLTLNCAELECRPPV